MPSNNLQFWNAPVLDGAWDKRALVASLAAALNATGVLPALLALQRCSQISPEAAQALVAQLDPHVRQNLFAGAGGDRPPASEELLRAYVTAATARDCSLLLRIEGVGGGRAAASAYVIDIDPKP